MLSIERLAVNIVMMIMIPAVIMEIPINHASQFTLLCTPLTLSVD